VLSERAEATRYRLLYIGSTYDYEKMFGLNQAGNAYAVGDEPKYEHNRLTSRQFFMKLQYLLQI